MMFFKQITKEVNLYFVQGKYLTPVFRKCSHIIFLNFGPPRTSRRFKSLGVDVERIEAMQI